MEKKIFAGLASTTIATLGLAGLLVKPAVAVAESHDHSDGKKHAEASEKSCNGNKAEKSCNSEKKCNGEAKKAEAAAESSEKGCGANSCSGKH